LAQRTILFFAAFGFLRPVSAGAANEPTVSRVSADAPFQPRGNTQFEQLVGVIQSAPELRSADREARIRDAARQQAHLWPNPTFDATWGTIPVGRTNPPNLSAPMSNVPNYRVGLSYTFPLGKRGPIQAARQAEYESATFRRCAVGRQLALDLARVVGDMAEVELRIAALSSLVEAAREHERSIAVRERQQWASGLEVDRSTIERGRLEQQKKDAQFDVDLLEAECATMVGRPCESFGNDAEARQYLETWSATDPNQRHSGTPIRQRPDLMALQADERAANHQQTYYRRLALPDPTIRVGFIHDQFVISGNQASSLELTVAFPLPMFDWGQAGVRAAGVAAEGFAAERHARAKLSEAVLPSLVERWAAQRQRRRQLIDELIPKAQAVLASVERAYETRLLSVTDVIQARRTLLDLLLEEIEGLADAYAASLGVRMHLAERNNEGCLGTATE
jgi:outer membrane protein, heavy metal efflux system